MSDEIATTGAATEDASSEPDTSSVATTEIDTATDSSTDASADVDDKGADDKSDAGDTETEGNDTSLEAYADFDLPEGMQLDETVLTEATPIFKELGLGQEQAQKLVEFHAKQVQAGAQKQAEAFTQLKNDWKTETENDSEIGGDKYDENVKLAQATVARFGTDGFKKLMDDFGIGNHPEMVRVMAGVGRTLKEDVPDSEGNAPSKAKDRISILYPNDK